MYIQYASLVALTLTIVTNPQCVAVTANTSTVRPSVGVCVSVSDAMPHSVTLRVLHTCTLNLIVCSLSYEFHLYIICFLLVCAYRSCTTVQPRTLFPLL